VSLNVLSAISESVLASLRSAFRMVCNDHLPVEML